VSRGGSKRRGRNYLAQRAVLRTIQKPLCTIDDICRAFTRFRQPVVDALLRSSDVKFGVLSWGELWLEPIDVHGSHVLSQEAVVNTCPWYFGADCAIPFNVMNHIISGIFAGNAVVARYRNIRRGRRRILKDCAASTVTIPIWCRLLRVTEMWEPRSWRILDGQDYYRQSRDWNAYGRLLAI
jgi:hypothetical protein